MTDRSKTELAVILDRSGSMEAIRDDMVGGYAAFMKEQLQLPGTLEVSLYQFDDEFSVVYEAKPAAELGPLELVPRGSTALLDAVGKAVVKIGERLAARPECERPGAVVVVVITDGRENASREYKRARIREMLEHQEKKYGWKFVYLGADPQGFAEARDQGFTRSFRYDTHADSVARAYLGTSRSILRYRSEVLRGKADADLHLDRPDDSDD